jgi:outer membrane protein OmpA-like peptidoglycan-associated protein
MKKLILLFMTAITTLLPVNAQDDAEKSKDPVLFTRMPGFYIYRYDDIQFDSFEFIVGQDKSQAVEGHSLFIVYWLKDDVQQPGALQIVRNYTNAIKKIGGQVIYEWEDGGSKNAVMKLVKDGKETWAYVYAAGNTYNINIIEKEAMTQDVVADASSMAKNINETGKVAVYGIYFDTGKSSLKPESAPTLQEIAKLLKSDPSLKLYVVGHTDNTGVFEANIKLSIDRANAVVDVLVSQHGVNAARLKAWGNGPTAPVAANNTEEGKALNRRVELVKQ